MPIKVRNSSEKEHGEPHGESLDAMQLEKNAGEQPKSEAIAGEVNRERQRKASDTRLSQAKGGGS